MKFENPTMHCFKDTWDIRNVSLGPSQQFFSHAGMGLPGLNQY